MASTFASGTAFAGLIVASAVSMPSLAAPLSAQAQPGYDVKVEIVGLRDTKGVVRLCLTSRRDDFPDCKKSGAIAGEVRAARGVLTYTFRGVPAGNYAIATFHDANGDRKLNTTLGIPREGFGFSRNPSIKPRAPRFDECNFTISGDTGQRIVMKYML